LPVFAVENHVYGRLKPMAYTGYDVTNRFDDPDIFIFIPSKDDSNKSDKRNKREMSQDALKIMLKN
jgi:hypothetical protein